MHHYDDIGLLRLSRRNAAGYRLYSDLDLPRLQQILFYRELDIRLDRVATILADPDAGIDDHLRLQRQARNQALLAAIEKEMEAREMGISLTPDEQFDVFGTFKYDEQIEKVKQRWRDRWGDTDPLEEAQRRMTAYTKEDWIAIMSEGKDLVRNFADAFRAGEPPTGLTAMDVAEAHRQYTSSRFFDTGYEEHRRVAEMYIADSACVEMWDADIASGYSQYVHDAILANADRAEGAAG